MHSYSIRTIRICTVAHLRWEPIGLRRSVLDETHFRVETQNTLAGTYNCRVENKPVWGDIAIPMPVVSKPFRFIALCALCLCACIFVCVELITVGLWHEAMVFHVKILTIMYSPPYRHNTLFDAQTVACKLHSTKIETLPEFLWKQTRKVSVSERAKCVVMERLGAAEGRFELAWTIENLPPKRLYQFVVVLVLVFVFCSQ